MDINGKQIQTIQIPEFPKTTNLAGTGAEYIPITKADGTTYAMSTADFKAFLGTVQVQVPKALSPTDPAPALSGAYYPTITQNEAGTPIIYANAGNLSVNTASGGADYGSIVQFIRDSEGAWSKIKIPVPSANPADSVQISETGAVSGDKIFRAINNNGSPLISEGFLVKSVTSFPVVGKAVINGNAGISDVPTLSITDLVELPEDWHSVEYYHIPSDTYGIGFYNSAGNAISLTLPNTQDSIIEIKKEDYPQLINAKYVRLTKLNNPSFDYKNKLVIKTKIDLSAIMPEIVRFQTYSKWVLAQENAGNSVVEYDYKKLQSTPSAGLKRSSPISIQGWKNIYALIPASTAQKISFLNASFVEVGSIAANIDSTPRYAVVDQATYPTAEYVQITGVDATRTNFRLSVSFDTNKKSVKAEAQRDDIVRINGESVAYLPFDITKYFTLTGAYYFSIGTLNTGLTAYRATPLLRLPDEWSAIEYDGFLSGPYGLVFFDEVKRYVGYNPNPSTAESRPTIAYRENFSTAKYFAYAWGSNLIDLNFKIRTDWKRYGERVNPIDLDTLITRQSNVDITNFDEWNAIEGVSDVTKEKIFSNTEFPGRTHIRVPVVEITNSGSIIAMAECRNSAEDKGQFDVYLKRRVGAGAWTSLNLFPYNTATYGRAMNPSFIIDRSGVHGFVGRIYAFVGTIKDDTKYAMQSTRAEIDFIFKYSDDDGATWSASTSLKSLWLPTTEYVSIIPSPENGIQLTDGTFVIPTMVAKDGDWRSGILYKRTDGTWIFSKYTPRKLDNECVAIEVNGQLLLNSRTEFQQNRNRPVYVYDFANDRFTAHSSDSTFNPYTNCKASIIKVIRGGQTFYVMSYPDSSKTSGQTTSNSRFNLTLWSSLDCVKWVRSYVINAPLSMGYSQLAYRNSNLLVAYEVLTPGMEIELQNLSPLLDKLQYDAEVNSKLTAEERINRLIYMFKGWGY